MEQKQDNRSLAEKFASLPMKEQEAVLKNMTNEQLEALKYNWKFWGRPKQQFPTGEWDGAWFILGRGWGKTRTGAELLKEQIESGTMIASLCGQTPAAVRDIMIFGESGIMSVFPEHQKPVYKVAETKLIFHTGAYCNVFSGANPERSRGYQSEYVWFDELCAYDYPEETYDNLILGLRLGKKPRYIVTTTPKPTPLIIQHVKEARTPNSKLKLITGSTYENKSNLPEPYMNAIKRKYEGTTLGRQEIHGEILDLTSGALWNYFIIDRNIVERHPTLIRIVVAIDPAVSTNKTSDETGIVVAGIDKNETAYVLHSVSGKYSPREWGDLAVSLYNEYMADCIVAEKNQGGDLITANIQAVSRNTPVKLVHAARGKVTRAEPVVALCEQDRVKYLGKHAALWEELTTWVPSTGMDSPNLLDAKVWAITELLLTDNQEEFNCW